MTWTLSHKQQKRARPFQQAVSGEPGGPGLAGLGRGVVRPEHDGIGNLPAGFLVVLTAHRFAPGQRVRDRERQGGNAQFRDVQATIELGRNGQGS